MNKSESLEAVIARAMLNDCAAYGLGWDDYPKSTQDAWAKAARAALAAIEASGTHCIAPLEPTDEMIGAGDDIFPIARGTETHRMAGGKNPEDYYRVMLTARPRDITPTDPEPRG